MSESKTAKAKTKILVIKIYRIYLNDKEKLLNVRRSDKPNYNSKNYKLVIEFKK